MVFKRDFNCFKTLTYIVLPKFILNWFMKDFQRFSNIFYKRIQIVIFSEYKGFSSKFLFHDVYFYLLDTVASLILILYSYLVTLSLILVVAYT